MRKARLVVQLMSVLIVSATLVFLGGCAHYATPGKAAEMRLFAADAQLPQQQGDPSVVKTIDRKPMATLPTAIAVVRVQGPGYTSTTATGWGTGAYTIVTERDIENQDQELENLRQHMPMCRGLAPINRLLLPQELKSDVELRQAAGALHADMLLVYTLDTSFNVEDVAAPLTVVTLGLSPNQVAHVDCTASAVLLDTRNGYVYGIAEATERQSQLASAWTSEAAVDQTRRRVEGAAFKKLVGQFQQTWTEVVANLKTQPVAAPAASLSGDATEGPRYRTGG